ncbi:MAG: endonuclease/exonuclease/phosphatase family protein [Parabacteroides gordonii]|nr:endonuclease/exonuclease/phosphatase family protein [Parabacteroides gordonii]
MKYVGIFCYLFFIIFSIQASDINLALHLDGQDNNVRTGIGILKNTWTLEAWIKGDDNSWKDLEVIFGGGEYSQINIADYLPLVIEKGKLHNIWADLWSKEVLNDQWHHVALSCDGFVTRLYLDGEVVDSKTTAVSVLPGAIGVNEGEPTTFGGLMDEVRIWNSALSAKTLNEWMGKPLEPTHPQFKTLIAYYNFDDGIEDVSTNWVGKGNLAFHLRNGRNKYKGTVPMAYTVVNDNSKFTKPVKRQELFNAVVIDSEWDTDQGCPDDQILKLRIAVTGKQAPLSLTELSLDLSEVTALSDISRIHVYYTGKTARSGIKTELFGQGEKPQKNMVFKDKQGVVTLTPGINYILVTADIADKAGIGNKIKISVPSFKLGKNRYSPENSEGILDKQITESRENNPNIVKVLQWDIWHGGVHVGNDGLSRIIDLIKASHADIVTMQEGYGGQQRIKETLGYNMQTHALDDNLVLFSRYPITQVIPTKRTFFSNPVKLTLPGNRPLLVNACWLRYAYRPEYSCYYPSMGHNTSVWVAEDAMLGLVDAKDMVENDTKPYQDDNAPVIIGGDFNSCSHLDWTAAAAPLHYGYSPVPFPISQYMLEEGYKDSFREMNPDEVGRPEGTFAATYGHLQVSRIDFLYYKGKNIRAVNSKIIKTAPEIDDVWASDHAAVMTIFDVAPSAEQ